MALHLHMFGHHRDQRMSRVQTGCLSWYGKYLEGQVGVPIMVRNNLAILGSMDTWPWLHGYGISVTWPWLSRVQVSKVGLLVQARSVTNVRNIVKVLPRISSQMGSQKHVRPCRYVNNVAPFKHEGIRSRVHLLVAVHRSARAHRQDRILFNRRICKIFAHY